MSDAPENDGTAGVLCAACHLTLTQAGFNPCDQSALSCPPEMTPEKPSPSYDDALRWLAVQAGADQLQIKHPDYRRGQALFNALYSMDADLANLIRGTDADPFHNGSRERVQAFARAVMDRVVLPASTDGES